MKLHIAMLAATLLLSGGASYAQGNKQEKKAKAYMVADAHLVGVLVPHADLAIVTQHGA